MAERINEANYSAMITALYSFANNVYTSASEMQSLASVCVQAIGDEDNAAGEIYKRIKECLLKYAEATEMAKGIAEKMQEELEAAKEDRNNWSSDD